MVPVVEANLAVDHEDLVGYRVGREAAPLQPDPLLFGKHSQFD